MDREIYAVQHIVVALAACLVVLTLGSEQITQYQHCNSTCRYIESAKYANCKSLNLHQIPAHCSSAIYLDMRKNDLQYLDRTSLAGFAQLKYVYLDGNEIRNITPGAFAHCTMVQQIFLQNNHIRIVKSGVFRGLGDLRHLYLNSAMVQVIQTGAFDGLYALERLYLSDNAISTIPHNLFQDLSNLEILTLANNHIETLAEDTFQGLLFLEYLDLKFNSLTSLPSGLFRGLSSLKRLTISYNSINVIEKGSIDLVELRQLEILDMRNNSLGTVKHLSNSETPPQQVIFYFAGNPISCDCHSKWLLNWYELNADSSVVNKSGAAVICQGPPSLTDLPMRNITKDQLKCKTTKESPLGSTTTSHTIPKIFSSETLLGGGIIYDEGNPVVPLFPDEVTTAIVFEQPVATGIPDKPTEKTSFNESYSYIDKIKHFQSAPNMLQYVAIGLVIACAIIGTMCLVYFCWGKDTAHDTKTEPDQSKSNPPMNHVNQDKPNHVHLTINPAGVDVSEETYEEVIPSLRQQPIAPQRSLPTPPLERPSINPATTPLQQQPNSGYITATELPPPYMHSISEPAATGQANHVPARSLSQPQNNIAANVTTNQQNPFGIIQHAIPGISFNPNMQGLSHDQNNNQQSYILPCQHTSGQHIIIQTPVPNGMPIGQNPIEDYSKCAQRLHTCKNPFCCQQPLHVLDPQHDPT